MNQHPPTHLAGFCSCGKPIHFKASARINDTYTCTNPQCRRRWRLRQGGQGGIPLQRVPSHMPKKKPNGGNGFSLYAG